jgi:hypothetical protein
VPGTLLLIVLRYEVMVVREPCPGLCAACQELWTVRYHGYLVSPSLSVGPNPPISHAEQPNIFGLPRKMDRCTYDRMT